MSHSKERHEKICLNCNAELTGRYCHVCGQENIEPKETVWGLVSHFFYDITHFDGKFFSTTKYLVTKPGFLPKEYIRGRRASYLHPIRMYVFSSAIFFLIFFSMFKPEHIFNNGDAKKESDHTVDSVKQLNVVKEALLQNVDNPEDSAAVSGSISKVQEKLLKAQHKITAAQAKEDSIDRAADSVWNKPKVKRSRSKWNLISRQYKSLAEYDSSEKALPPDMRDGWWKRKVIQRNIAIYEKYGDDDERLWEDLIEHFMHSFPALLFVSLPLYALFMKLLYFRHKRFFYVEHGIFFIYLYIFTFIFLLVYFSIQKVHDNMHWSWMGWIEGLLLLAGVFYTYKAMRNFYGQGRAMTILKFCLLNMMAFITLIFLFIFFFTLTVFRL